MWRATSHAVALVLAVVGVSGCGGATGPGRVVEPGVAPDPSDERDRIALDPGRAVETGAATEPPATVVTNPDARPTMISGGLPDGMPALDEALIRWHADEATTFEGWFEIAVLANRGRPLDGADELMVDALHRAVPTSGCAADRLGKIRLLAIAVRGARKHSAPVDANLARLADVGPEECRAWK